MSRTLVSLRTAVVGDAPFLATLWQSVLRRADRQDQIADLEVIIKTAAESPEHRLLVAEYDGSPAGAVYLRASTLSTLNLEPTMQALAPHVLPEFRRRGVGRALMEAAVSFAEELGIGHVVTAALAASRDGNRFMARLGLGPQAVLRVAPTGVVRGKLESMRPAAERAGRRQLGQVLAVRRSMRRSPATDAEA